MDGEKSLGQIAFEAYGDNREWKDWRGQPMPAWSEVRQEIRDAWEVAAKAVANSLTTPRAAKIFTLSDEQLRSELAKYPTPSGRYCCFIDAKTVVPCRKQAEWMIVHGPAPDDWTDACSEHLAELMTDAHEHRVFNLAQEEKG